LDSLEGKDRTIVPGTAIFLTADGESAPTALLHSLKHYKVLHEHNVILTVRMAATPRVADDAKVNYEAYSRLVSRMTVTFGYMETPNVPPAPGRTRQLGWTFDLMGTGVFLSRRHLKLVQKRGLLRNCGDRVFE